MDADSSSPSEAGRKQAQAPYGPEDFQAIYTDLRRLAQNRLARLTPGATLAATELVHEAYLRLAGRELKFDDARHLFFAASRAMHDIVVERARKQASSMRGKLKRQELDKLTTAQESPPLELLELSEALSVLQKIDSLKHELVMLRFFGQLTSQQCADAMRLSLRTVEREWRYARTWLRDRMKKVGENPPGAGDGTRA